MGIFGQDPTLDFLRSWLEMAERETEAIQRDDWESLRFCQDRIRDLQAEWEGRDRMTRELRPGSSAREEIRSLVSALIERERYNQRLLAERLGKLRHEMEHWNGVAARVRRFSRGMSAPARSVWSRFS